MSRFNAPLPNGDSRRAIQQRAREASQPLLPEKKACWPFSPQDLAAASAEGRENPAAQDGKPAPH